MRKQRQLICNFARQLLADKRHEQPVQSYRRENGVPGLFQSKNGLHSKIISSQARALPVRLLHAPGIDQIDFSNTHGCCRGNCPIENFGARKREDQSQWERIERFSLQSYIHFEGIVIDTIDVPDASSSADDSNPQFIAVGGTKDFANVMKPTPRKTYTVFVDKVFAFEQYVIQIVTEW